MCTVYTYVKYRLAGLHAGVFAVLEELHIRDVAAVILVNLCEDLGDARLPLRLA